MGEVAWSRAFTKCPAKITRKITISERNASALHGRGICNVCGLFILSAPDAEPMGSFFKLLSLSIKNWPPDIPVPHVSHSGLYPTRMTLDKIKRPGKDHFLVGIIHQQMV